MFYLYEYVCTHMCLVHSKEDMESPGAGITGVGAGSSARAASTCNCSRLSLLLDLLIVEIHIE